MVLLQTCCCCIDLRIGAIIIGVLSFIQPIVVCTYAGLMYFNIIRSQSYGYKDEYIYIVSLVLNTFVVLIAIAGIIFTILMIYGATKRKHSFILAWLIAKGIFLVIEIVSAISLSAMISVLGHPMTLMASALTYVIVIVITGIEVYLYLCISSCYQKIRDENLANPQDAPVCRYIVDNEVPYVSFEENKN